MELYISERKYYEDLSCLVWKVQQLLLLEDTAVVAVYRGGLIPGQLTSYALNLPLSIYFPPNHTVLGVDVYPPIKNKKNILLIDDLIDSGRTAKVFLDKYKDTFEISVAVLYNKRVKGKLLNPDVYLEDTGKEWIRFFYDGGINGKK